MFLRPFLGPSCRVAAKPTFLSAQHYFTSGRDARQRSLHLACRSIFRHDFTRQQGRCRESPPAIFANDIFFRQISISNAKFQNSEKIANAVDSDISRVTNTSDLSEDVLPQIPEVPTPIVSDVAEVVQMLGEPTFASLGLNSWWPAGWVQRWLEIVHVTFGLPWWATIMATTFCIRVILFPLVIKLQRYTVRMSNVQPETQYYHAEISDARKMGDYMEALRLTHELQNFMKEKEIDPAKNAWLPLVQAPVFLSFYWALRGMVNIPVESMKEGGIWWFTDLTVPDPYYILPLITCTSVFITLEMGTDTLKAADMGFLKYFLRCVPIVMFPIIIKFDGAILCYWVSSNTFSLLQCCILRSEKIRTYFGIPKPVKHDIKKLPKSKKNFAEGFSDAWSNIKVAREVGNRALYDERVFRNAGKGPVPKTYKFDPTKIQSMTASIDARKNA